MKKIIRKLIAAGLGAMLMVTSMAGCSTNSSKSEEPTTAGGVDTSTDAVTDTNVKLKVWGSKDDQELLVEMCRAFAENHSEYTIDFEFGVMEYDGTIDALKKDAEVAADVFFYPSGGVSELTEAGLIYPFTLNVDKIVSQHSAGAIRSCTLEDKLYGIPVSPNSWFMYYNSSMYSEEEVKSLETMMAKDLGEGIYNFSCDIDNSWYMSAFFFAPGGTLYGSDGTDPTQCSWNDPVGYESGKYLLELVNNPKYVEDGDGLAGNLIAEGKLGALCSGTWSAKTLKEALGENYAASKLPTIRINGADNQLSNFADFTALGVNTMTKYPKPAMELAEWLGGEECQLLRFEKNSIPPTIMSLLDHPAVAASKETAALSEQTNYSTPNPKTSKLADYWEPAAAFGAGIVNGDITEVNLQQNLDKMVEGFLAALVQ